MASNGGFSTFKCQCTDLTSPLHIHIKIYLLTPPKASHEVTTKLHHWSHMTHSWFYVHTYVCMSVRSLLPNEAGQRPAAHEHTHTYVPANIGLKQKAENQFHTVDKNKTTNNNGNIKSNKNNKSSKFKWICYLLDQK